MSAAVRRVAARRRAGPQGLPDPRAAGARRPAAGLPRHAATSQKPRQVLDALDDYYERHNANVHRGMHTLAEEATALYEGARDKVAAFVSAPTATRWSSPRTPPRRSTWWPTPSHGRPGRPRLREGDEIVITEMEHHSNIVPWQLLAERTGATLRWFGLTDDGRLDLSDLDDADQRAHQARLVRARVQHPRHGQPGRARSSAGPRGRRAGRARRLPVGAAPAGRRAGARVPTSSPSPATRCAGRPASACCGAAASCSTRCRRSSAAAR